MWRRLLPDGVAILGSAAVLTVLACSLGAQTTAKPDAAASRAAFLQVYRVLTSPCCQNCYPAGDAPLQGDDSHVHLQNVKRGADGHGVTAMQNGGRSLEKLLDHIANDDLVGWGWNPGDGRTPPPLSRADTVAQMKIWIAGGAACPQ